MPNHPRKVAVIDGANIAHEEVSNGGQPKIANLQAVRLRLREAGYDPLIIVDASLRHAIDDPDQLEALIDSKVVHQAPAGTEADYFVVETAERTGGVIVSNDRFDEYQDEHPWIRDRRIPLMIIRGEVHLYEEQKA